ncbi:unnamed protein product [Scytosiphon promiscuus]
MQSLDHALRVPDRVPTAARVSKTIASTPLVDGYQMPAEWEVHERRVFLPDSSPIYCSMLVGCAHNACCPCLPQNRSLHVLLLQVCRSEIIPSAGAAEFEHALESRRGECGIFPACLAFSVISSRTWMLWPTRPDTWKESARPAQLAFAKVAKAIARFEPVTVGVPSSHLQSARTQLDAAGIEVVVVEQDDAWMRDTGPVFVVGGTGNQRSNAQQLRLRNVRGVDWSFNAWGGDLGGCFSTWDKDNAIASEVLGLVGADRYKAKMILEGGSVHVDGEGTVITTEECLLNPNRNPTFARSEIENNLRDYLGVESVLWLGQGVIGDSDTDGHVDNLVAFVRPGEVVLHWTDDTRDPQHAVSSNALRKLEDFTDAKGRQLKVHKCPLPGPLYTSKEDVESLERKAGTRERIHGDRLAASYVNFYLANGAVILPGFGVPEDEVASQLFKEIFPGREIVQVNTLDIALGGGNIHCITQQQPRGTIDSHTQAQA